MFFSYVKQDQTSQMISLLAHLHPQLYNEEKEEQSMFEDNSLKKVKKGKKGKKG